MASANFSRGVKKCAASKATVNDFLKQASSLLGVDVAPFHNEFVKVWRPLYPEVYSIEWLEAHVITRQLLSYEDDKQGWIEDCLNLYFKAEMECDPHDKECAKRIYSHARTMKGERVYFPASRGLS